jgi:hypothetical protein
MNWLYYEETLTTYHRPQGKKRLGWRFHLCFMAACLLIAAGGVLYGWWASTRPPRDPRPEVNRFVDEIAASERPIDMTALRAYRANLPPHERSVLHHDINYLLWCRGFYTKKVGIVPDGFVQAGQIADMSVCDVPGGWTGDVEARVHNGLPVNTESVGLCLWASTKRGDTKAVNAFMADVNGRLRPYGKVATWDGNEFRVVKR